MRGILSKIKYTLWAERGWCRRRWRETFFFIWAVLNAKATLSEFWRLIVFFHRPPFISHCQTCHCIRAIWNTKAWNAWWSIKGDQGAKHGEGGGQISCTYVGIRRAYDTCTWKKKEYEVRNNIVSWFKKSCSYSSSFSGVPSILSKMASAEAAASSSSLCGEIESLSISNTMAAASAGDKVSHEKNLQKYWSLNVIQFATAKPKGFAISGCNFSVCPKIGPGGIRTLDLLFTRQALQPTKPRRRWVIKKEPETGPNWKEK